MRKIGFTRSVVFAALLAIAPAIALAGSTHSTSYGYGAAFDKYTARDNAYTSAVRILRAGCIFGQNARLENIQDDGTYYMFDWYRGVWSAQITLEGDCVWDDN
jgi:hypothetical protein